jgi:hypothetical protein
MSWRLEASVSGLLWVAFFFAFVEPSGVFDQAKNTGGRLYWGLSCDPQTEWSKTTKVTNKGTIAQS